jgi:hypothetical protein
MNLFDIANFSRRPGQYRVRDERIKREGSEPFVHKIDTLTAGNSLMTAVENQFPKSRKYAPLDWLELTNNDAVDLELLINQTDSWSVPAGIIKTIADRPIHTYKVTNLDAGTDVTASKVRVTLKRQAITIDAWARGTRL